MLNQLVLLGIALLILGYGFKIAGNRIPLHTRFMRLVKRLIHRYLLAPVRRHFSRHQKFYLGIGVGMALFAWLISTSFP